MTSVSLGSATEPTVADVVLVGAVSTDRGIALAPGAGPIDAALGGGLLAALRTVEAAGRLDEVTRLPTFGVTGTPLVVVTGLGRLGGSQLNPEAVRRGVGAAFRSLNQAKRVRIAIGEGTDPELVGAISDGALLGCYRFTRFKSGAKPAVSKRVEIAVTRPAEPAARAALRRSKIVAEAVNNTRDLVNMPANLLNPITFAEYARVQGEAAGLIVQVLDERALKRGGYGAILGVGAGSATPPRLVRLSYTPAKAVGPGRSVALVGKGITFDTGGLDLKLSQMGLMKSDMGGAAAVIESVIAAAKLKLPVAVTATVPMAENAVSGTSYRPSDVLVMHDGRTVEVDNTDAEGRLILADAILRACEDSPDYLIDAATLTGAQLVALGEHTSGAMGTEAFRDEVVAAGLAAGESLWAMPLTDDLRPRLDSAVADITNLAKERWGSMLVAGSFLRDFVADGVQWAHLDIAGPALAASATGYNQRGGTGVIVRTIIATLTRIAEADRSA